MPSERCNPRRAMARLCAGAAAAAVLAISPAASARSMESAEGYEVFAHVARLSTEGMIGDVRTAQQILGSRALDDYLRAAAHSRTLRSLLQSGELDLSDANSERAAEDVEVFNRLLEGVGVSGRVEIVRNEDGAEFRLVSGRDGESVVIDIGPDLRDWVESPLHDSLLEPFEVTLDDLRRDSQYQGVIKEIQPIEEEPVFPATDTFLCTKGDENCSYGAHCTTVTCTSGSCTSSTGCTQFWCTNGSLSCTSGPQCTLGSGCTNGGDCTAGNTCTSGGGSCTHGEKCTKGEGCTRNGSCTSNPSACTSGANCTNSSGGTCTAGTNCTRGDQCTGGDKCSSGTSCTRGAGGCTLTPGCTTGPTCSSGSGCTHTNRGCTSASGCTNATACTRANGCTSAQGCWERPVVPSSSGGGGSASYVSAIRAGASGVASLMTSESSLAGCAWLAILGLGMAPARIWRGRQDTAA